jgi:hypothetical protein
LVAALEGVAGRPCHGYQFKSEIRERLTLHLDRLKAVGDGRLAVQK